MKRLFCALLALCCCLALPPALADGLIELEGASNYSLCYGPPLALHNGDLLLTLSSLPARGAKREAVLLCLAPDGSTVWRVPLEEPTWVAAMTEETDATVLLTLGFGKSPCRQQQRYSLADGSLLWKSERVPVIDEAEQADENLYIRYTSVGDRFLREETHDASASCEPRYYQLETFAGDVLWRAEATKLGFHGSPATALAAPQGTVLVGDAAVLVREDGSVTWRVPLDAPDGSLPSGYMGCWMLHDGTLLLRAVARVPGEPSTNYFLGLDSGTGELLWQRELTADESDHVGRMDALLETEQGILLSDSNGSGHDWSGSAYWLLGDGGVPLAYWENVPGLDATFLSSTPFFWQGEIWAETTYSWRDQTQVALLRVELPNLTP